MRGADPHGGALYRRLEVVGVRAVATSAIRDTRNQKRFSGSRLRSSRRARGNHLRPRRGAPHPSGGREQLAPQTGKRVLIIDIGGGSAEIIAAEDGRLREAFSKPLGAVRLREIFLTDDPPTPRQLHQMHEYIREKLASTSSRLGQRGWTAQATSATASAVASAIARLPRNKRDEIDRLRISTSQVRQLYAKLSVLNLAGRRKVSASGHRRQSGNHSPPA